MKKKNSYTPIAVGTVIALIGVLLGLYFAENAHERLAQYSDNSRQDTLSTAQTVAPASADTTVLPMPLEPIDTDIAEAETLIDEPLPQVEETITDNTKSAPVPELPITEASSIPSSADTGEAESTGGDVDDFVEVDPAEEERRAAVQRQATEQQSY